MSCIGIGHDAPSLPVEVDGAQVGTLYLKPLPPVFGGLDLAFASAQWRSALLAGCAALIGALLLAFALARWLLAPVRALTRGMHALTAGDFAQRVDASSSDELGALARDFNHLAQTLEQHRDARRRWRADIAHELRTPLSILRGEVSALQDGVRAVTPAAFDSLQLECARLSGLIEDLYQLSLADAGALEYRFATVDLGELVGAALDLQRRACADAGLALEWTQPAHARRIRGDARRLDQLIDNLLANARRYTDAPGRIRVVLAYGSAQVRLILDDTAPGVPEAALPHLFERLYRVEASRNRASGGAGLGLAICRAIVEAHDGKIEATPSPLGGSAHHDRFPPRHRARRVSAAQHILIVEDETKIAALLRDYLVAAGYRVSMLETGVGAIEWIRGEAPDAIVLDLMLSGMDGLAILMLTARVEEIDRSLGLELGADDYICKPFSLREVVARVKAVLRRASTPASTQTMRIELDDECFEARVRGQPLVLTPVEFRLLRKLIAQPGRVYSRQQLMDALYSDHRMVSDRTVDSHVKNLRRKLADLGVDPIASIYGLGYRFESRDEEDAT